MAAPLADEHDTAIPAVLDTASVYTLDCDSAGDAIIVSGAHVQLVPVTVRHVSSAQADADQVEGSTHAATGGRACVEAQMSVSSSVLQQVRLDLVAMFRELPSSSKKLPKVFPFAVPVSLVPATRGDVVSNVEMAAAAFRCELHETSNAKGKECKVCHCCNKLYKTADLWAHISAVCAMDIIFGEDELVERCGFCGRVGTVDEPVCAVELT